MNIEARPKETALDTMARPKEEVLQKLGVPKEGFVEGLLYTSSKGSETWPNCGFAGSGNAWVVGCGWFLLPFSFCLPFCFVLFLLGGVAWLILFVWLTKSRPVAVDFGLSFW